MVNMYDKPKKYLLNSIKGTNESRGVQRSGGGNMGESQSAGRYE